MTPKQTALLRVAGFVITTLFIGFMVNVAFTYFTVAEIGIGFSIGIFAFLIHTMYQLELDRAQRNEDAKNSKEIK